MQQGYEQLPQALPVAQAVAAQPARPNALPIAQRVATVLATPAVTHDAMLYALEAGDGWGQPGPYGGMGGVANRRDWSGGLHQCCGASLRKLQLRATSVAPAVAGGGGGKLLFKLSRKPS